MVPSRTRCATARKDDAAVRNQWRLYRLITGRISGARTAWEATGEAFLLELLAPGPLQPHFDAAIRACPKLLRGVSLPLGDVGGQFRFEQKPNLDRLLAAHDTERLPGVGFRVEIGGAVCRRPAPLTAKPVRSGAQGSCFAPQGVLLPNLDLPAGCPYACRYVGIRRRGGKPCFRSFPTGVPARSAKKRFLVN